MRIFSNFDTSIRKIKLKEYQDKYGSENVLLFGRSVLYRVIKVFLPTTVIALISFFLLLWFYMWLGGDYFRFFFIAILLVDLVLLFPKLGKYIDYKMDFIIVTPDYLVMYDQRGIIEKNVVTINEKSIKTIFVKRPGLLYSAFNNGDIIFLSEGDTNYGEITLRWVAKPEKRRNDIARIMMKDVKREMIEDKKEGF